MKHIRTLLLLIAAVLLIFSLAAGCTRIPEAYTDGVKLDRAYPEDDMPIMDDAVIYYCDEDDDEITIKYGVEDDLDDVVDYYRDHFDDNDMELDDETDKSTRYAAEGTYSDFSFKLRVSEPSDEYAQQVFETVVKIEIVFVEETAETTSTPTPQASLNDLLTGFWQQESFDDGTSAQPTAEYGIAYEFIADGTLNVYSEYTFIGAGSWSVSSEDTVLLTAINGSQSQVSAIVEQRDGKEYLTWTDSTGVLVFYRESKHTFMLNAPDPDEQLTATLADTTWYYVHYSNENSEVVSNSSGSLIYYSDGTFEDTFDNDYLTGTWYVKDGRLYCSYDDDNSASWIVEVKSEGSIRYLYYYSDSNPLAFWLYADQPIGDSSTPVIYTSDADIEYYITDTNWHEYYYIYADGTLEEMTVNTLYFWPDGTLEDTYNGETSFATWYITDGYLYITYEEDTEAYIYPVYITYEPATNTKYLYMGDLTEGFEGCNWVFTDYEP